MRILGNFLAIFAALVLAAQPAAAQSILRDAETEALLQDMAAPLVEAAGLKPGNVDIVLVNDPSINAFVAGGQVVYLHSGLIDAADTANEVQGVIAHELGHITGGHIIRSSEGMGTATNISIVSLLLGVAAAVAGAGDAAMGVIMAGQQAAMGKFLAFTRVQESSADAAGVQILSDAGISGRGSLAFFKKLQNQEFRYGFSQSDDAAMQQRFERVKAKLFGYLSQPARTLQQFPESRTDVPARYARAYAYHKNAMVDQALAETQALLELNPSDPYFLELEGQILLESGKPDEALDALRQATELTNSTPLIASVFGHALIATEDAAHFDEAEQVLRAAVGRDRLNPFAWYQLGVVYAQQGDLPRARLASAEQQVMTRRYAEAIRSAQAAEIGLEAGTPDWIRAQDIGLQARAELERQQKRK